eukprot:COSAG01_NODE_36341_length_519_cov_0.821429_1_plen_35_part_01
MWAPTIPKSGEQRCRPCCGAPHGPTEVATAAERGG